MGNLKIGLASDHGGYSLKEEIKIHLLDGGYEIVDYGTDSEESVDYPIYGKKLAEAIVDEEVDRGLAFCGTGIGISLAVNKVKGVRCALVSEGFSAEMARKHNDAQVLALGGRTTGVELAKYIVDIFLNTEFEGGRHQRRVDLIED